MDPQAREFRHRWPPLAGARKTSTKVCESGILSVTAQAVERGGENNLHLHTGEDAFWYVVRGAVRFHGQGDEILGEFGSGEGILIPRDVPYWFESMSGERLEILRIAAKDPRIVGRRVDLAPRGSGANLARPGERGS